MDTKPFCPFKEKPEGGMLCHCGNDSDNKSFGFRETRIRSFVTTSSDPYPMFQMGFVAANVCNKCGATWPMGELHGD